LLNRFPPRPSAADWPATTRDRAQVAGQLVTVFSMTRTLLSTSLTAGVDLRTVQEQLGHSSIVLTADTYT